MWQSRYWGLENRAHSQSPCVGVLLVNLGTPEAPTAQALRPYLAQFLSDPRVVEAPRWLWKLVLHGVILRRRPSASAQAYKKVWTEQGSPLKIISEQQATALQRELQRRFHGEVKVKLAMSYGQPSIDSSLKALLKAGAERVLVLPAYPQYSGSTVGSVFDAVSQSLQKTRWVPDFRFINSYVDHPGYIQCLVESIQAHWQSKGRGDKLVLSYHGIPKRYLMRGDPYFCQCMKTSRLVAEALGLKAEQYMTVFQSRFGREEWLQPYCDKTLEELPSQGTDSIDIICPGFAADCLETLEEIAQENRDIFLEAGGKRYEYIPCLNAEESHIRCWADLVMQHAQGWPELEKSTLQSRKDTTARAKALGAEL